MSDYCVITTIAPPTSSVSLLGERLQQFGVTLVMVGDRKGPEKYELEYSAVDFLPLSKQQNGPYELGRMLPTDHYRAQKRRVFARNRRQCFTDL